MDGAPRGFGLEVGWPKWPAAPSRSPSRCGREESRSLGSTLLLRQDPAAGARLAAVTTLRTEHAW